MIVTRRRIVALSLLVVTTGACRDRTLGQGPEVRGAGAAHEGAGSAEGGAAGAGNEGAQSATPPTSGGAAASPTSAAAASAPDLSTAVAQVARNVIPAVVNIEVVERRGPGAGDADGSEGAQGGGDDDTDGSDDDAAPQGPLGGQGRTRKFHREVRAIGSGMIVDSQGDILTSNHVVSGAKLIRVLLSNGTQYKARVVGTDPKTDLAVIRIAGSESLPHVIFGDSDKVEVGDWVIAVGHPRGLAESVTQGIISAKHRAGILDPTNYEDFLQTDAAINPGNSGGPLLSLSGDVIGVNTMIASTSGGSEGIGFAIPSNMAVHAMQQLISTGRVQRGWLGMSLRDLTPRLASAHGLSSTHGALVEKLVRGGPGAAAGFRIGDVVTQFQGDPIETTAELRTRVASSNVGDSVTLSVIRDGKPMEIVAKVGDLGKATEVQLTAVRKRIGASVREPSAQEVERFGLDPDEGVVITDLLPDGALAEVGFEVGDIIVQIDDEAVSGLEDFAAIVDEIKPGAEAHIAAIDHRTGNGAIIRVELR